MSGHLLRCFSTRRFSTLEFNEIDKILNSLSQPSTNRQDGKSNFNADTKDLHAQAENGFLNLASKTSFQYIPLSGIPNVDMFELSSKLDVFSFRAVSKRTQSLGG